MGRGRSGGWAQFFSFFFASWVCLKLEEPLGKKAVSFGLTGGVRGTAGPVHSGCGHGACWTVLCAVRAACCSEEGEERWAEKRASWGSRERKYERERWQMGPTVVLFILAWEQAAQETRR